MRSNISVFFFFFSSRRRHTILTCDWSSDVCSSDLLLFGIPSDKDPRGSEAYADDGIVQQAVRDVKDTVPDLLVITDVCLCQYTSHGHCGVVEDGTVKNDPSLELIARVAVSQAEAGADMVAPSDMMDGRVGAIREALDESSLVEVPIMAYSA